MPPPFRLEVAPPWMPIPNFCPPTRNREPKARHPQPPGRLLSPPRNTSGAMPGPLGPVSGAVRLKSGSGQGFSTSADVDESVGGNCSNGGSARAAEIVNQNLQEVLRAGAWGRAAHACGCRWVLEVGDFHFKHVLESERERQFHADVGATEAVKRIAAAKVAALHSRKVSGRSRVQSASRSSSSWNMQACAARPLAGGPGSAGIRAREVAFCPMSLHNTAVSNAQLLRRSARRSGSLLLCDVSVSSHSVCA